MSEASRVMKGDIPNRAAEQWCAYLLNSKVDPNHWKRGHSVHPLTRQGQIQLLPEWKDCNMKRVASFPDKQSALSVERGMNGFGRVFQGREFFEYDYSKRQVLYNEFDRLCSQYT